MLHKINILNMLYIYHMYYYYIYYILSFSREGGARFHKAMLTRVEMLFGHFNVSGNVNLEMLTRLDCTTGTTLPALL